MTALSILKMNWTLHQMEMARWEEEAKYAKAHPRPPFLYWSIYRKAKRSTKRNGGWVFLRDAHATVEEMQAMMKKYSWYLPNFKISYSPGLVFASRGEADDERIFERAEAICRPDYSIQSEGI